MGLCQRICVNPAHPGGGSHLVLSPDGRFLYVSSRLKNDGIGIFAVGADGGLTEAGYCPTGKHPRHFCLSPDGGILAVACRDDDRVECYRRDSETGLLTALGFHYRMEAPVYVEVVSGASGF